LKAWAFTGVLPDMTNKPDKAQVLPKEFFKAALADNPLLVALLSA